MRLQTFALAAAFVPQSIAETIRIDAGPRGAGDAFIPNTVQAAIGDVLEFHFFTYGSSHDVAMGDFDRACAPAQTGGFYSGVISTPGGGENVTHHCNIRNPRDILTFPPRTTSSESWSTRQTPYFSTAPWAAIARPAW